MVVVVYGKEDCGYCTKAMDLLGFYGIAFAYHDIDASMFARAKWLELTQGQTPRTVPQVVIDGELIGGFDKLKEFLS